MKRDYYYHEMIGWIEICVEENQLVRLEFLSFEGISEVTPLSIEVKLQLNEYFLGVRENFDMSKIPVLMSGTEFQQKCWNALLKIPYAETCSYQEQAIKVGSPQGVRAVGGANSKNPIAILYPCHRVIGKNGKLTGFAGGLDIKERLLNFEKANSIRG